MKDNEELKDLTKVYSFLKEIEGKELTFENAIKLQELIQGSVVQLNLTDTDKCSVNNKHLLEKANGDLKRLYEQNKDLLLHFISMSASATLNNEKKVFYVSLHANGRWNFRLSYI